MDMEAAQRILKDNSFNGSPELLDAVEFLIDTLGIEKYDALYRTLVEKAPLKKPKTNIQQIQDYIHDYGPATTKELALYFGLKQSSLCTKLSIDPNFVSKYRRWRLASRG